MAKQAIYLRLGLLAGLILTVAGLTSAAETGPDPRSYAGPTHPQAQTPDSAAIGGGVGNQAGDQATVGGGYHNEASGFRATIGGGSNNVVEAGAVLATISGGFINRVLSNAIGSAIGGGSQNEISWNASGGTIAGGAANVVQPGTWYATIPGGFNNEVGGRYGLAAGYRAKAQSFYSLGTTGNQQGNDQPVSGNRQSSRQKKLIDQQRLLLDRINGSSTPDRFCDFAKFQSLCCPKSLVNNRDLQLQPFQAWIRKNDLTERTAAQMRKVAVRRSDRLFRDDRAGQKQWNIVRMKQHFAGQTKPMGRLIEYLGFAQKWSQLPLMNYIDLD